MRLVCVRGSGSQWCRLSGAVAVLVASNGVTEACRYGLGMDSMSDLVCCGAEATAEVGPVGVLSCRGAAWLHFRYMQTATQPYT